MGKYLEEEISKIHDHYDQAMINWMYPSYSSGAGAGVGLSAYSDVQNSGSIDLFSLDTIGGALGGAIVLGSTMWGLGSILIQTKREKRVQEMRDYWK